MWATLMSQVSYLVQGDVILEVRMVTFKNSGGKDWTNDRCDPPVLFGNARCDHKFTFCFDTSTGNSNSNGCSYRKYETGEFTDGDDVTFDHDMKISEKPDTASVSTGGRSLLWLTPSIRPLLPSMPSIWLSTHLPPTVFRSSLHPCISSSFLPLPSLHHNHDVLRGPLSLSTQGAIRFKVKITDVDSIGDDDLVDLMNERWSLIPARSVNLAKWSDRHIVGTRPVSSKTSLTLNLRLYCNQNYYNQRCDQFCKASSGPKQHYTCDPDTGDKMCRPGWEGHNCDFLSDDCIDNECSNGATCRDDFRRYTCVCPRGFTGEHCKTNINDCAAYPCQNGGQCVDQTGGYKCTCIPGYVGVTCSLSVCHSSISPCQNGGSCYTHSGSPRCLCPPEFTGDDCQLDKCAVMTCANQGTCENGKCVCRAGYLGHLCEINLCSLTQCLHGATCQDGVCHCVPGYNGRYCETQINECDSDPCQHEGTCRSRVNGYTCRCLPANSGVHCELVIPTQPALEWNHVTTPGSVVSQSPADSSGPYTSTTGVALESSDVRTISTSQSFPLWTIAIVVSLLIIILLVVIAFVVMRRRLKKKASSAEASVQFQRGPDDDELVTGISNPDYDDAMTGACNGVCNGCHSATPPPYTSQPKFPAKTPPLDVVEVQNMSNAQFVNQIYDSPPPPRDVAAVAAGGRMPAGAEAPQLPIKAALRRGEELE
ncbi:hypothetical protein LSAT2_027674 [Lamellibrachia satsuma]|nr:hypothetical protein LSAT2_027674 [Lamellibrachia satsuma]